MVVGSQCGEDKVFEEYFGDKIGYVVELGAADGKDNSNSYHLIQRGWSGILLEPDPEQYAELLSLYHDNNNVKAANVAAGTQTGQKTFYTNRQVSTLDPSWRDRCIEVHNLVYDEITVIVMTLTFILEQMECPKVFDLLSIDCEGMDQDVLASLDLGIFQPELICIEAAPSEIPGYVQHHKTCGNTIFRRVG